MSNTFLQDIANKYYDLYVAFSVEYTNINVYATELKMILSFIIGIGVGIIIAAFMSLFTKRTLGDFVRRVIERDALSPESAKTLDELDYFDRLIIRRAVAKSVSLRRVLKCREEEEFYAEQKLKREEHEKKRAEDRSIGRFKETEYKVDADKDSFFIPEDLKYMAEIKFDKKGATLRAAIATSLITLIACIAIILALPELLEFLDGLAAPNL
ncbi:MAG: hypothetical protein IKL59_04795 [Clostridia bacterium]|nr:hypothetical protein [Clostridia bacterium]